MNKAERIERLAEWRANEESACSIHWAEHMREPFKRWHREKAETELDFLASIGAVWVAAKQDRPKNPYESTPYQRTTSMVKGSFTGRQHDEMVYAQAQEDMTGWRKVEGS